MMRAEADGDGTVSDRLAGIGMLELRARADPAGCRRDESGAAGGLSRPQPVAIAHDYLTQRGGAERVVLALAGIFPEAGIFTTLFHPDGTFPELARSRVQCSWLDRLPGARTHHRLALPLLAPATTGIRIDAEVTVCSSSGWAHGVTTTGRKVVYCHTPARWLYQADRYLDGSSPLVAPVLAALGPSLRRWDRTAAATADRYLVNSHAVRKRVENLYGIEAEVLPPPVLVDVDGPVQPIDGIGTGFVLCVSRLLGYKNVSAVIEAFGRLPGERLVVVGTGPLARQLAASAPRNVTLVGAVDDARLRWLYRASSALVSASYEDFGLTPIEAAAYGKPVAVLRWGGFLDTLVEGETGEYVERPEPRAVIDAMRRLRSRSWDKATLRARAGLYAPERFAARIREIVEQEREAALLAPGARGLDTSRKWANPVSR